MSAADKGSWWQAGVEKLVAHGWPARPAGFESTDRDECDVIVVGSGLAGFSTAILAHDAGSSVVVLEAADDVGGTTFKSGAAMWIPNNFLMRGVGIRDDRDECLRYMAQIAHPDRFDLEDERYGVSEWEWSKLTTFYDNASDAIDALVDAGAFQLTHFWSYTEKYPAMVPYRADLDTSIQGYYRHVHFLQPDGTNGFGTEGMRQTSEAVKKRGIDVRTKHRVRGLIQNEVGEIVGVAVDTDAGTVALYARQGVVFASGGFAHNLELLDERWRGPLYSSCAVPTAQGDFVGIGLEAGAELGHMRNGWLYEDLVERTVEDRECTWGGLPVPPGDSMIYVDRTGRRVVNEKLIYQDRSEIHWVRDENGEYPNRVLFMVYDDFLAQDERPWIYVDTFRAPKPWIIEGATLEELATNVQGRLVDLGPVIGPMELVADFAGQVRKTIERFNRFARQGKDEDFHRGETPTEYDWNGPPREGNNANQTMYPFRDGSRFYCALVSGMVLDTNGGPKTNAASQVMRPDGTVITGLYGAGNCVAAVAGDGYFSGGSTLGPAVTFAYLAAKHVTQEEPRDISAVRGIAAV